MNKHLFMTFGILAAFSLFCGCASVSKGDVNMGYDQGISEAPWVSDGENYQYDSVTEQGFCDAQTQPSSYFSLDRNTAGYSLVRTQVKNGLQIAPDSVRLEEMVNYFDYDYPAPEKGEGVSLSAYLSDCPWKEDHRLMTVGIRTEEAEQGGDANYVLLVDVSGSTGSAVYGYDEMTRLDLVRYAANKMVDGLDEKDRVSIVTYASGVRTVLESTAATDEGKQQIRNALARLSASGSTSGSDGLQRAYEQAEEYKVPGGNNRVVLLTDGDFNVGIYDTEELTEFIREKAESGVGLSVVGVGLGNTRDDLMQTLALNGNGSYCYMDTKEEAEKVFTKELAGTLYTVAYNAKAGVTFNADRVSSYRLLGYDMKHISAEDFENPEKDTGEIGSNLCVTVLYELELNEAETEGSLAEVAVRWQDAQSENAEAVLTVTGEEGDNEDVRFAACVAEFALVLRRSQYAGSASIANVLARLNELRAGFADDVYKTEFVQIVSLAGESGFYGAQEQENEAQ